MLKLSSDEKTFGVIMLCLAGYLFSTAIIIPVLGIIALVKYIFN